MRAKKFIAECIDRKMWWRPFCKTWEDLDRNELESLSSRRVTSGSQMKTELPTVMARGGQWLNSQTRQKGENSRRNCQVFLFIFFNVTGFMCGNLVLIPWGYQRVWAKAPKLFPKYSFKDSLQISSQPETLDITKCLQFSQVQLWNCLSEKCSKRDATHSDKKQDCHRTI